MSDVRAELLTRLQDPRALPILLRHAIPVIGVFVFHWSPLETVAALVLDAVSTLWLVAATGSYFAAQELDTGEPGILPALHFWAGVLGLFLFVAGLLTFAVAVPASFFLALVGMADLDPWELVQSGWAVRAFGFMLLCQVPSFVQRVRYLKASGLAPEKMGMDAEVGFVLHRIAILASMGTMLAVFGSYALHVLVIVAQAFGAGTEIMRDRYVGALMMTSSPAPPKDRKKGMSSKQDRRG